MQPPDFGEASRRTEEILLESEERFRLLVEGVKDYAIFMLDPEGHVTTWNLGAQRIKGYEAEEIIGEHFSIFYTDKDVERGHPEEELRVAAAEGRYEEEGIRVRKDGSPFWANVLITALRDEQGNLRGFAKVTRDITERNRSAEELRRLNEELEERVKERTAQLEATLAELRSSEERYRLLVESTEDYAIFMVDREGRVADWNVGAERIFGYREEEMVGKPVSILFTPEDVQSGAPEEELRKAVAEGRAEDERWHMRKDGTRFWASGVVTPIRDEAGNVRGFAKVARDDTERTEAEKRLREAETRYRTLVEQIPAITYVQEPVESSNPKAVTYMSPQYETILEHPAQSEVIDEEHWYKTLHPEDRERVLAEDARTDETGEPFDVEYRIIAGDGRIVWLRDQATLVRDEEGRPLYWLGVQYDITEQKRAEQALREIREAERRRMARDLHDGVLQDLSYTTAAMGLIRLNAEGTGLEQELQKVIDAQRRAAEGLRNAVNDLRHEEKRDRPFPELVESLVQRNRAMVRGYQISLEVAEGFPSAPLGEVGTQMLRIIREALTNARRHSGARNVIVTLRVEEVDMVAEISDDGQGFGAGTSAGGVGLRSMRERAAALGGKLQIESAVGEGTTVRLRAPISRKG
jgi:PAS domain S-box-containing protein